jgi:hypothetical protein
MLPLNGATCIGDRPASVSRSTASAPLCSMLARVVSKWALFGTILPRPAGGLPIMTSKRMRSLARPWCVGRTLRNPVSCLTTLRKRQ